MVESSSSSSSSCDSFSSFDEVSVKICNTVKFVCSHGGRILPRYPDGRLRYVGGENRVLTVDRTIPFSGLQVKLGELCGWEKVNLRCQLPTEDLDALVSISSDEDLANLIEEYDLASRDRRFPIKIRAFLHPTVAKSRKSVTPPSTRNSRTVPMNKASFQLPAVHAVVDQCVHKGSSPTKNFVRFVRSGDVPRFHGYPMNGCPAMSRHHYLIHQGTRCP
ncbi:uncharacterized protein LOC110114760 [Dendrobium catenatum]|uniref:PB1 domain-containing protein n=1 Tax=Dendrobium catenatum TaxID=906689 RepID=A0A2I0X168_9ASPA|nr:uncharacterized protein LOC110114760 [Dendrobium catenatum]XP_020703401.1 uncharacterized protein LOC110114760 [Dendrobium catenatum]PKU81656.1 hypothetical protein MA16_Dca013087 [Dendrobium catenatum]